MSESHLNGDVSRRQFMAGAAALGVVPSIVTGASPARAQAATPKRGGRLRQGLAGGVEATLDPAIVTDAVNQNINYQTKDTLVEVLPDLTPGPELFESWEATPDAKTWRFKVRSGVTFHNGKTLGPDDIMYSINYHRNPNTKSAVVSLVRQIEDMKADGKNTVVIALASPNADFPIVLSDYHFNIVPDGTTNFNLGIGTGGYVLDGFEAGVRTFTKRNPNYWRTDRGFFDEIETLTINDTNARTNALVTGQVDHINRLDLRTVKLLERNPNVSVKNVTGFKHFVIDMMTDKAPFDNADLRLAMKWAINRKEIVEKLLAGYGFVGNDHPISPQHRFFNKDLPQRDYDADKAKFHLKKSGMEGQTFELRGSETGFDGAVDAMVLFQQSAAKAGINFKLVREPIDGYWTRVWKKTPFFSSFYSSRPSEDMILTLGYAKGSVFNETNWDNERFNTLLVAARAELDENKRRAMYYEMQQILSDDCGAMIPIWMNQVMASSPKLAHPKVIAGNFENDGHRNCTRWWFA
jgi:peptide/nickel transport system substrate-binding protein